MKIRLIVYLLALCLTLSVIPVQAQSSVVGDLEDIDLLMNGNITEDVMCSITGYAFMVEEMDNMTDMANITDMDNMTGMNNTNMSNVTERITLDVTGRMILIKDIANMTEKAVMIGRADNMSGSVVIFGRAENISGNMSNMSNMSNLTGNIDDMTVLMTGNATGTFMINATEDMDNVTASMVGNMSGNITGDMTRETVIIGNVGNLTETAEIMNNIADMAGEAGNMTEPMTCNMTGKMVIVRGMNNMTEMDMEDIDNLVTIEGDTAIIGDVRDITEMGEDINEDTYSVTRKFAIISSMDDMIGVMTNNITCNITQNSIVIGSRS